MDTAARLFSILQGHPSLRRAGTRVSGVGERTQSKLLGRLSGVWVPASYARLIHESERAALTPNSPFRREPAPERVVRLGQTYPRHNGAPKPTGRLATACSAGSRWADDGRWPMDVADLACLGRAEGSRTYRGGDGVTPVCYGSTTILNTPCSPGSDESSTTIVPASVNSSTSGSMEPPLTIAWSMPSASIVK